MVRIWYFRDQIWCYLYGIWSHYLLYLEFALGGEEVIVDVVGETAHLLQPGHGSVLESDQI